MDGFLLAPMTVSKLRFKLLVSSFPLSIRSFGGQVVPYCDKRNVYGLEELEFWKSFHSVLLSFLTSICIAVANVNMADESGYVKLNVLITGHKIMDNNGILRRRVSSGFGMCFYHDCST